MRGLIAILITPVIGCATMVVADPIFRNGSTGLLNEAMIVKTYEISSAQLNFELDIKMPKAFKNFKYATLIASKTKNRGGWEVIPTLEGNKLNYCIKAPASGSPVTMALSTPYLIVAHNKHLEISEDINCN